MNIAIITPAERTFTIVLPDSQVGNEVEVIASSKEEAKREVAKTVAPKMTFEEFRSSFDKFGVAITESKFDREKANFHVGTEVFSPVT